jgi:hypothetical protein
VRLPYRRLTLPQLFAEVFFALPAERGIAVFALPFFRLGLKEWLDAVRFVGREDSLIPAPRERHRQGTGVALC